MCGITALFAYRSSAAPVDRTELEAITAQMISRGPDAGATWISDDGRVGLGSRRLAIIDLSPEGTQPMWDVERELVIVFNGEIYNYRELRASLERQGSKFHSHTDTEVLLALFRRHRERMLGLLRGMFAFAIWDTRERRMFVARDPYGIKPLYFSDDGGTIRIASQVKALLAGGAVSRAVDPAGAAGFFLLGSVPEPFTIRRDVSALEAATSFFVDEDLGQNGRRRYFSIAGTFASANPQTAIARLTEPEILLRERVSDSVLHHLESDVPVGIFLSAGIDSSVIALMASRLSNAPPLTFTLDFGGSENHDEAEAAKRFAAQIGSDHTARSISREEFLADLPQILGAMDQPTIDGVNTWFVSKTVHERRVKVVLSGIGGDELFGSYPAFANIPRLRKAARVPLLPLAAAIASRARLAHPKLRALGSFGKTHAGAYLLQRALYLPDEIPKLLPPGTGQEGLTTLFASQFMERALSPDPESDFGRVASLEASLYMRNQLLPSTDWASMAHSVEVRTPLITDALLRQIAPLLLLHGSACKKLFGAELPNWLRERPKRGFAVPIARWMQLPPDGTSTRMRSWARMVFEARDA